MQGVEITLSHIQETLRRVKENDETLKALWIGGTVQIWEDGGNKMMSGGIANNLRMPLREHDGVFNSSDDKEFTSLGAYIAENTHLTRLFHVDGRTGLDVECLRSNSSIHKLNIVCGGRDISESAIHDILQVYQEKGNLTLLYIDQSNLQNGGVDVLVNTLRSCTNLKRINLHRCGITDEQVLAIVEAIRGNRMLEDLRLGGNHIGNVGCGALATLLEDLLTNIQTLNLGGNTISNEGAITIANSLANSTTLRKVILHNNPIDQSVVEESFCKILCNTSSISDIYSSNHTLKDLPQQRKGDMLLSLLKLNRGGANKVDVAVKKILKHYPNLDMEPIFEWDAEEGERNLKALPYVVDWFQRAESAFKYDWNNYDKKLYNEPAQETIAEDVEEERFIVEKRKLDAINQFARAMPLLFEGVSTM